MKFGDLFTWGFKKSAILNFGSVKIRKKTQIFEFFLLITIFYFTIYLNHFYYDDSPRINWLGTFWISLKSLTVFELLKKLNLVKICGFLFSKKIRDFKKVFFWKIGKNSVLKITKFCFFLKIIEPYSEKLPKNQYDRLKFNIFLKSAKMWC